MEIRPIEPEKVIVSTRKVPKKNLLARGEEFEGNFSSIVDEKNDTDGDDNSNSKNRSNKPKKNMKGQKKKSDSFFDISI